MKIKNLFCFGIVLATLSMPFIFFCANVAFWLFVVGFSVAVIGFLFEARD